ncbi:MAG: maleylpyruvate isomerase family mycothiol-dependent enzyme [Ilumatobacteraceae bacterium]
MNAVLDAAAYVDHNRADVERFAAAIDRGPLDAQVAACPGWDVARLAAHLGSVHRWATRAVIEAAPPDTIPRPDTDTDWSAWLREGAGALIEALESADLDAPTWHPFPVDRVGRVWPRRQAHETAVHRWDAEAAIGAPSPIDAQLASDGIDEYFEIVVPRLGVREHLELPDGSFHVHCTDVPGEWLVERADGALRVVREHAKGDAALRGPAEAVLLRLWNRASPLAGQLDQVGDAAVAAAWLALPGM